jgi:hypothetical protein
MSREGFRLAVVHDEPAHNLLGFAYGYTARPGQWWYEQVAAALPPQAVDRWLSGAFELAELAVTPRAQRQGLGGRLHDTLLAGLSHRTAVLSTIALETVASGLYRKRGWIPLIDKLHFSGVDRPYCIMGLDLQARRPAQSSSSD